MCLRDKAKNRNNVHKIRLLTTENEDHTHEATIPMIKQNLTGEVNNIDHLFTVPYSIWKLWVLAF